jgi:hypothetical protein
MKNDDFFIVAKIAQSNRLNQDLQFKAKFPASKPKKFERPIVAINSPRSWRKTVVKSEMHPAVCQITREVLAFQNEDKFVAIKPK